MLYRPTPPAPPPQTERPQSPNGVATVASTAFLPLSFSPSLPNDGGQPNSTDRAPSGKPKLASAPPPPPTSPANAPHLREPTSPPSQLSQIAATTLERNGRHDAQSIFSRPKILVAVFARVVLSCTYLWVKGFVNLASAAGGRQNAGFTQLLTHKPPHLSTCTYILVYKCKFKEHSSLGPNQAGLTKGLRGLLQSRGIFFPSARLLISSDILRYPG